MVGQPFLPGWLPSFLSSRACTLTAASWASRDAGCDPRKDTLNCFCDRERIKYLSYVIKGSLNSCTMRINLRTCLHCTVIWKKRILRLNTPMIHDKSLWEINKKFRGISMCKIMTDQQKGGTVSRQQVDMKQCCGSATFGAVSIRLVRIELLQVRRFDLELDPDRK